MKMKKLTLLSLCVSAMLPLVSCLGDDDDSNEKRYADWKKQNEEFVEKKLAERNPDGTEVYTKIVPDWSTKVYILMKWHNDRSLTEKELVPLENSTCNVKYLGELIDGEKFDSSFSLTENGDSIYLTQPYKNIPGFWAALTQMHVGDSVTAIIPWSAAYGSTGSGSTIKPFSTLVFHLKLKAITNYQTPS